MNITDEELIDNLKSFLNSRDWTEEDKQDIEKELCTSLRQLIKEEIREALGRLV